MWLPNRSYFSSPWAGRRPMTPPVEKHFQERSADTADLSTTLLRSSGRDDKRGGLRWTSSDGCWKRRPQISPLRCAPVEMTKGRAALPLSVVAEQEPFSSTWVGPTAHDFSGRRTFPGKVRWTADLSTPLRSGRDDKGEDGASSEGSCWKNVFHPLGWAEGQ